jgi:hypothetical protein
VTRLFRRGHRTLVTRALTCVSAVCLVVSAGASPAAAGTAAGYAASGRLPGSVPAPTAATISPICVAPDAAANLGPQPNLPAKPVHTVVTPRTGVVNFTATAGRLYVNTGATLATYTLAGARIGSFPLPAKLAGGDEITPPVVAPDGDIYLASYYGTVIDKFSPSGRVLWSVDPGGGNPTGLFATGSGPSFGLAVSLVQHSSSSDVLDPDTGAVIGQFPYVDDFGYVTLESDGRLLVSGDGYVTTRDASGAVVSRFGAPQSGGKGVHTGGGTQFYYPAQAIRAPDGTIYTADPLDTIETTTSDGHLQGSTTLGGQLAMGGYGFFLEGSTLYFQGGPPFNSGGDNISAVPLATVQAYLTGAQVPADSLGWGAGLTSSATGNYFAAGTTPEVSATFDPWWVGQASHLELSYTVENTGTLTAERTPALTTIDLPTTVSGLGHVPLAIPAGDRRPGPYLVQASLFDTSTSPPTRLGTTCLPYSVGAPGDRLDFSTLPGGIDSGGPGDTRGVALSQQLGLNGFRSGQIPDWSSLLPDCKPAAPTAATCGPSAMTFTGASDDYFKAAALALADHVRYWVQVSGGDAVSTALATSGLWQGDVAALVAHYAAVPTGCGSCAPVTTWEAWNEPNNTGWPDGGQYVTKVLAPFYAAVKSVEPGGSSTVIGGSSLNIPLAWWRQLITAGGLHAMDVASVHPYPGNNDNFEEWGEIGQIRALQALLGPKPLWFSEVGWWSDGDYNYLHQADAVARALLWQKVLGIPVWSYYFTEGDYQQGTSFSLIQATSADDYVKPSALATMTESAQVGGRPFEGMPSTGIPSTYEATFGTDPTGGTHLAAVWSDGLPVAGSVTVTSAAGGTVPVTVTSEYGRVTRQTVVSGRAYRLGLSDQVAYIATPAGSTLTLRPTEAYGADLATGHGVSATASSGRAAGAIAGTATGSGWTSGSGDTRPRLTVRLSKPAVVNRVVVDTQSVGSTATSVRNYVVAVERSGGWVTVGTVVGQFRHHQEQLSFAPVEAAAVRITISMINYGGYYGGGIPPFVPLGTMGAAFLHSIKVYAGTSPPARVDGSTLPALLPGS